MAPLRNNRPWQWLLSIGVSMWLFVGCAPHPTSSSAHVEADTLKLAYAKGFVLIDHGANLEVQIRDPWKESGILQTLQLCPPYQRTIISTAAHAALIGDALDCLPAMVGVCESQYIADTLLCQALAAGLLQDLGSATTPDMERMAMTEPDLLLTSPFENARHGSILERMSIPVFLCADYMEPTALARAEWMRLYGRLYGVAERADSLFAATTDAYHTLQTQCAQRAYRPTVFFDMPQGSAWYTPGGQSTLASLVADAGGRYVFADDHTAGSIPCSLEEVLLKGSDADIWLIRYSASTPLTLDKLRQQYPACTNFRAVKTGNVWACNNADNRFFEEFPFHPERLLADFAHIFSGAADSLRYFHPVR